MMREHPLLDASSAPTSLESQVAPINSRATGEALYREKACIRSRSYVGSHDNPSRLIDNFRRNGMHVSVKLTDNQASMLRKIQWFSLQFPLENVLISIGKRFNFHWKTIQFPLENVLISIGKRSALGLDVRQNPMGFTGKKA